MPQSCDSSSSPPPRRSKKRDAILASARVLFNQEGFPGTSMDAIAAHAQVSKATVYAHFPSKQLLFCEVVSAVTEGYVRLPEEFLEIPIEDGMRRIAQRFLEMITRPEALTIYRTLISQGTDFPEMVEAFRAAGPRRVVPAVAKFFQAHTERGTLDVPDPVLLATIFLHAIKGEAQGRLLSTCIGSYSESQIIDEMIRMIVTAYAPKPKPADTANDPAQKKDG